jgi:Bacterial Ig-like domain
VPLNVGDTPSAHEIAQGRLPTSFQGDGEIRSATGTVMIASRYGTHWQRQSGDLVHAGDVLETASDGVVLIAFADGTVCTLSNNPRMALSEFTCDPDATSGSTLFGLRQGPFAFNVGKVARGGRLRIGTPAVMLQARTQGDLIGFATLAAFFITSIHEAQSQGQDIMFLEDGTIADYGIFELLTKEAVPRIIRVDDPTETVVLRRVGSTVSVNRVTNSPSQMERFQDLSDATGRTGGSVGSGTTPDSDVLFHPINFIQPIGLPQLTFAQNSVANSGEQQFLLVPPPPEPPEPPVPPSSPVIALSLDSGISQNDLITNNGSLTVNGVAGGATVEYSTDEIGWSSTPPQFTSDGTYTIFVRQFESPGNISASSSLTFILDTTAPTTSVAITVLGGSSNISFTRFANALADFFVNSSVLKRIWR